jgi:hypothetical protein
LPLSVRPYRDSSSSTTCAIIPRAVQTGYDVSETARNEDQPHSIWTKDRGPLSALTYMDFDLDRQYLRWEDLQRIVENTVAKGGRLHFNLEGIDGARVAARGAGPLRKPHGTGARAHLQQSGFACRHIVLRRRSPC